MSIDRSQRFWKFYLKFKKVVRFVYELSSFLLLFMSFEKAYKLKTWSVVKTWQVTRLAEKLPRFINLCKRTFMAA